MLGLHLESEVSGVRWVTGAPTTMKKMGMRGEERGKPAQLRVLGPDPRMMGEVWWKEGEQSGGGWRGVMMEWLRGRWKGVGMFPRSEVVGRRTAVAQTEYMDLPPYPAGLALSWLQRSRGVGAARVMGRWEVRVRRRETGMEAQEQEQVQMESL